MMAAMAASPAMHAVTLAGLIVIAVGIILLRLATAGDERRQAVTVAGVVAGIQLRLVLLMLRLLMLRRLLVRLMRLMVLMWLVMLLMLLMLMLRAALLRLLIAATVGLRFARRERLAFTRWIGRLVAEILRCLRRLAHLVIGFVEGIVLIAVHLAFGAIIGVLLTELFLRRGDQAEIMFGMLVIVFGGDRIAGGHRIAGQLNVFLGDVRCGSANFHVGAV